MNESAAKGRKFAKTEVCMQMLKGGSLHEHEQVLGGRMKKSAGKGRKFVKTGSQHEQERC